MRKQLIRIVKYTTLFIAIFFFIFIIFVFGIWTLLQVRGSLSFKPVNNISITVSGVSFFPEFSIQNIHINLLNYNTDLEFRNIQLEYSLLKLQILNIHIKECNIHANISSPISSIPVKQKKLSSKRDMQNYSSFYTYLPEKLFIENISLITGNDEGKLSFSNIPLKLDKTEKIISIFSSHAIMEILYEGKKELLSGQIDISNHFSQKAQEINVEIQFLPHIFLSGKLNIDNSLQKLNIENIKLSLDETIATFLSLLPSSVLPTPVGWEKIQINNLNSSISYQANQWIPNNIDGNISLSSLTIGKKEKPWFNYSSNINIHSHYIDTEQTTEVILSTEKEPIWTIEWKYNHINQNTYLDFSWNVLQGTFIKNLSPYIYDTLMLQMIEPFSIEEGSFTLHGIIPTLEGKLHGKLLLSHVDPILLDSNLYVTPDNEGLTQIVWNGKCSYLSTPIYFSFGFIPSVNFTLQAQTEKFPVKMFQAFTPSILKNALADALADLHLDIKGKNWDNLVLQLKGQLLPREEDNMYPPIVPSEFQFQGTIQNLDSIDGSFHLSSENSADFELNPCKLRFSPISLEGTAKAKIYLSTISSDFIPAYLPGKTLFNGKLYWDGTGKVRIQGSGSGDGLGIGSYILPEEIPLCFDTNIIVNFYDYILDIDYLKMGFTNCNLVTIQKSKFRLPSDNHNLAITIKDINVQGTLNDLQDWGISQESQGTFMLTVKDLEYNDSQISNGEIEWNVAIQSLNLPAWQLRINNFNSQLSKQNMVTDNLPMYTKIDEIYLQNIKTTQIESALTLNLLQPTIELEQLRGNLWNGVFTAKGIVQRHNSSIIGNITGQYNHIDLSRFTEDIQPPWIKITGTGEGNFDLNINFTTGQLIEGDFNLTCQKGLTINRDILLQLILYLQNISIVQKQLEKLLGKEDPKPFTKGELTVGFKNNQATVTLFLATPNINLAPIFYINADWNTLWSLITTPSGMQIEIK